MSYTLNLSEYLHEIERDSDFYTDSVFHEAIRCALGVYDNLDEAQEALDEVGGWYYDADGERIDDPNYQREEFYTTPGYPISRETFQWLIKLAKVLLDA